MSATGRVALFREPRHPFELVEMPVPVPRPGAVVVRLRIANVYGLDLHAWRGDFRLAGLGGKLPTVLGHEMTGTVAALGRGMERDSNGHSLREGDHVVFTYFTGCGNRLSCQRDRRATCDHIDMAMRGNATEWPYFVGAMRSIFT